jgi:hypothetical protein
VTGGHREAAPQDRRGDLVAHEKAEAGMIERFAIAQPVLSLVEGAPRSSQ